MVLVKEDEHVADVLVNHRLHHIDEVLEIVVHHIVGQPVSLSLEVLIMHRR